MRRAARVLGGLFGLVALLAAERGAGAAEPARLVYARGAGAEDCPDESIVRAAVAERMGSDPFVASAGRSIAVDIAGGGGRYHARIRLVDADGLERGVREIDEPATRCDDMIATVALSVSIALDPARALGPMPAPAAPPRDEPPAAKPPEPPRPPEAPSDPIHLEAALGPGAWVGAAPAPSVGGSAAIGIAWRRVSLDLEARDDLPASRRVTNGTVESSLVAGGIAPCVHAGIVAICGLATIGSLHAESRDVSQPKGASTLYAAGGARFAVAVPIVGDRLSVTGRVDGLVSVSTTELTLDGADVYTLPRASLGAGIGVRGRIF